MSHHLSLSWYIHVVTKDQSKSSVLRKVWWHVTRNFYHIAQQDSGGPHLFGCPKLLTQLVLAATLHIGSLFSLSATAVGTMSRWSETTCHGRLWWYGDHRKVTCKGGGRKQFLWSWQFPSWKLRKSTQNLWSGCTGTVKTQDIPYRRQEGEQYKSNMSLKQTFTEDCDVTD